MTRDGRTDMTKLTVVVHNLPAPLRILPSALTVHECIVLVVIENEATTLGFAGTNVISSRTSFVIVSVRSSIH